MKCNYKRNTVVVSWLLIPQGVRPRDPTSPIDFPFHMVLAVTPLNQIVTQLPSPFLKESICGTNLAYPKGLPKRDTLLTRIRVAHTYIHTAISKKVAPVIHDA